MGYSCCACASYLCGARGLNFSQRRIWGCEDMSLIQHQASLSRSLVPNPGSEAFAPMVLTRGPAEIIFRTAFSRRGLTDSSANAAARSHPLVPEMSAVWLLRIMPMSNPQSLIHRLQVTVANRTTSRHGTTVPGGSLAHAGKSATRASRVVVHADHSALLQGIPAHMPPPRC